MGTVKNRGRGRGLEGFCIIMVDENNYLKIGEIYREHGVKGFCKFYAYSLSDDHLIADQAYILTHPEFADARVKIIEIMPFQRYFLIRFDCFATPEAVKSYRKAKLWLEKSKIKRDDNSIYDFEFKGCQVYDQQQQKVGDILNVVYNPLRQFIVKRGSEEFFIPYVPDWVIKFDRKQKIIFMTLPEGLYNNI